MSKTRRIRKISVFTSGGKFPVLTLSYINTALSQSAFRIYKCYIINMFITTFAQSYSQNAGNAISKTQKIFKSRGGNRMPPDPQKEMPDFRLK
jgi:hypothetical protein